MARWTNASASITASGSECPSASSAAIAADSVQPVPCVLLVTIRGRRQNVQLAVVQDVDDVVAVEMAALHERRARPELAHQTLGRIAHFTFVSRTHSEKHRDLVEVGRDEVGERR